MKDYKKDFPIFQNNPDMVYLDSAASTQKPQYVIDGVSDFVSKDYANTHRGMYSLSERSEELYYQSKEVVGRFLNCESSEIIYSYNATYAINLLAGALCNSGFLGKGDKVLLGIWEHHADILPWQSLAEKFGFEVEFVMISDDYKRFQKITETPQPPLIKGEFDIDWEDFEEKYDDSVKVVAVSHVSNVTGKIYDVQKLKSKLREDTFFLVDGSQSVPHFKIDLEDIDCDAFVFTGHKLMAYTGIGGLCLKKKWIKELDPIILGGGTVVDVSKDTYTLRKNNEKWEAGTPNLIGAVSLMKAIEYIESIGGIGIIWEHEKELVRYFISRIAENESENFREGNFKLIGPSSVEDRVAVFSFILENNTNFNQIGEKFAEKNICIRCGGHCAYPLHKELNLGGTCRMSCYLYNDEKDIDRFLSCLKNLI